MKRGLAVPRDKETDKLIEILRFPIRGAEIANLCSMYKCCPSRRLPLAIALGRRDVSVRVSLISESHSRCSAQSGLQ